MWIKHNAIYRNLKISKELFNLFTPVIGNKKYSCFSLKSAHKISMLSNSKSILLFTTIESEQYNATPPPH
jgi:hypothetical protein